MPKRPRCPLPVRRAGSGSGARRGPDAGSGRGAGGQAAPAHCPGGWVGGWAGREAGRGREAADGRSGRQEREAGRREVEGWPSRGAGGWAGVCNLVRVCVRQVVVGEGVVAWRAGRAEGGMDPAAAPHTATRHLNITRNGGKPCTWAPRCGAGRLCHPPPDYPGPPRAHRRCSGTPTCSPAGPPPPPPRPTTDRPRRLAARHAAWAARSRGDRWCRRGKPASPPSECGPYVTEHKAEEIRGTWSRMCTTCYGLLGRDHYILCVMI